MEVKPGYKQTEVGVIPEDWSPVPLHLLTTEIGDGIHATPIYSSSEEYYFINGNNLRDGRIIITGETKAIDYSEFKKYRKDLGNRSILMSINGTIGNLGLFSGEAVILGKSAAYLNVNRDVSKMFVYHSLQIEQVRRQFFDGLTGTTIRNLGLETIRNTQIPLPPSKAEQHAIAAALSDVDALIAALDRLIAKKRDIEQAAMQVLLTGKRRLPGFNGVWENKKILEIAPLQRGFDLPTAQIKRGIYPVVYSNGVLNYHAEFMVKGPGVVTGRSGTIGSVNYVEQNFWPHNTSLWVTDFKKNNPKFIYYLYSFIGFGRFGTGSGVPTLNRNDVHAHQVVIPQDCDEQAAIVEMLSNMDAEIDTLEARREKTRALKQGMMQELLTGRIRLV